MTKHMKIIIGWILQKIQNKIKYRGYYNTQG